MNRKVELHPSQIFTNSAYMLPLTFNKIAPAFSTAERAEMFTIFAHSALLGSRHFNNIWVRKLGC